MLLYIHLAHQLPQPGVNNANGTFPIGSLLFAATKCFALKLEVAIVQSTSQTGGLRVEDLPSQIKLPVCHWERIENGP